MTSAQEYKEYVERQQIEASTRAKAKEEAKEKELSGAVEMSYAEYKNKYATCKTVANSYNKKTKTIFVIVNKSNSNGICPHCGTRCYGDCRA